jgi:hypothetical protein
MVIKVLQKGPSKCAFTQMHQTIKQKLNQESKNWYTKKSEKFTKNEMMLVNLNSYKFIKCEKNYNVDPKTWTQKNEDTYATMKFLA